MIDWISFHALSVTDAVRWIAVRRRLREAGSRFLVPSAKALERFLGPRIWHCAEVRFAFLPRDKQIIPILFKRRKPDEPERSE
jgi:hypothetical protein